jgi:hypothetical protein
LLICARRTVAPGSAVLVLGPLSALVVESKG